MTSQILETGLSPKYAESWGVTQALREVAQNWIDVREETGCNGRVRYEDGRAVFKDYGPGLEMRHLVMGISEKAEGSIGQFGEGLKLAMLVLVREGREVVLRTAGRFITPKIAFSEAYETEVLAFEVEEDRSRHKGTTVTAECSHEEYLEAKAYFEKFLVREPGFRWLDRGKISQIDGKGGLVLINGSVVSRFPDALFNYHLTGEQAEQALNRDRTAADWNELRWLISEVLCNTSSAEVMQEIIWAAANRRRVFEMNDISGVDVDEARARIWKRNWNEVLSDETVLAEVDWNEAARYKGYRIVEPPYAWKIFFEACYVKTARDVAKERVNVSSNRVARKDLDPEETMVLEWVEKVAMKVMDVDEKPIIVSEIPSARGVKTLGLQDNGRVYLAREVLQDEETALHTLLHEYVHLVSGENDLTAGFEVALLDVAVRMLLN